MEFVNKRVIFTKSVPPENVFVSKREECFVAHSDLLLSHAHHSWFLDSLATFSRRVGFEMCFRSNNCDIVSGTEVISDTLRAGGTLAGSEFRSLAAGALRWVIRDLVEPGLLRGGWLLVVLAG